jgi:hypothetical protein
MADVAVAVDADETLARVAHERRWAHISLRQAENPA